MAKGYWIIRADVSDQEQFKAYAEVAPQIIKNFGARFLVRGGRFESAEGSARPRNTVVEFPSYQSAVDCWHSPAYQEAIQLRLPAATFDLVIVEGSEEL